MLQNKRVVIIFFLAIIFCSSCIEEFVPRISSKESQKIFIYGQISDVEGYQYVKISTTSSIESPKDVPLPGCAVKILDNKGNEFKLEEYKDGEYRVWISKEFLSAGTFYGLNVVTSSGEEIVSDFDQMSQCPKIDTIYYERKEVKFPLGDSVIQGLQFYVDLDATGSSGRYFKWEVEETWEHHAARPIQYYWDGYKIVDKSDDYSKFVCWSTDVVPDFYIFSLDKLSQKKLEKQKLHFVDNTTQRLTYGYSILLKQYALSEPAYEFWENIKSNNDLGGIYGRQPIKISGNLRSETNPSNKVLGIFQAVSMQTKRIFLRHVPYIDLRYPNCTLPLPLQKPIKTMPTNMVLYLYGNGPFWEINSCCVLCDCESGTTQKPDFWPY